MWYKTAQKYNMFGLPLTSKPKIKQFTGEENDDNIENVPLESEEEIEPEIEDPTPENEITPGDVQRNIEIIENDPTANMKLPPLHNNCRCVIETIPFLSMPGFQDGRRIWQKAKECCPVCEKSAIAFNSAEIQRLNNKLNKLIENASNINTIPS